MTALRADDEAWGAAPDRTVARCRDCHRERGMGHLPGCLVGLREEWQRVHGVPPGPPTPPTANYERVPAEAVPGLSAREEPGEEGRA